MSCKFTIDQLEMMLAIAETESLAAAARRLNLSPPALTYRMQEAERRLDTRLFLRKNRRTRLSQAGERLHACAQSVLREVQLAERDISRLSGQKTELIRIGLRSDPCYRWMMRFLRHIRDRFPRTGFEIQPLGSTRPLQSLLAGEVDLEILAGSPRDSKVILSPLFRDELMAVVPDDHPLAQKQALEGRDFREETYVTYSTDPEPGMEYELLFAPANAVPGRFMKVGLVDAALEAVRAGLGITILPQSIIHPANQEGLCLLPIAPRPLKVNWQAAVRRPTVKSSGSEETETILRISKALAEWCAPPGNRTG